MEISKNQGFVIFFHSKTSYFMILCSFLAPLRQNICFFPHFFPKIWPKHGLGAKIQYVLKETWVKFKMVHDSKYFFNIFSDLLLNLVKKIRTIVLILLLYQALQFRVRFLTHTLKLPSHDLKPNIP